MRWLWAGVGGADSGKNPESPESAESAKNSESPESAKDHEVPKPHRKRHLLLENGFSIACSGTFKHPSLLEAGENSGRGALAVAGGLHYCEEVLIRVGCWGVLLWEQEIDR